MTTTFRDPSRLIFLDRLTQLYNWWFMAQYLKERFATLASLKIPLSVIVLDLDDFRRINETHGRLAGDVILRQVALLIHEGRCRGGYAVRYAGDEFFVFLEGAGGDRAMAVAEQIRARVAGEPIAVPHAAGGIAVTTSLGVATFPEEVETASGLIDKARRALAHAKRRGKNRASRDVGERLPTEREALERFHRPTLLGRERDLELCRRICEKSRAGGNQFILIEGEHGIGKSRFLAELPGLLRSAELSFIQGGCLAQSQAVPYSAVTPWLQEYFDRSPDTVSAVAARLSVPKRTALGSRLAALKPREESGERTPDPERRGLLFQGMGDLLTLISDTRPLVVLLENLHWADEASLEVLLQVLSRESGRLVVCATAATGAARSEPETGIRLRQLPQFLPYFQASPHFHRMALAPLTLDQVGEMATDILRHALPTRFQQQVFQVSRGVPLLVEETLKGLIMRGTLREEEGAWNFDQVTPEDFPASADEAITRGLENLDPDTLEVVSDAAVIGPDVDLPVLAEVLGQDPGETLDIVERGRRVGLFQPVAPVADPGEIRFTSDRLREVVYDGLDTARRLQTHRKVAQVYEDLAGPEPGEALGPLTYHFERSDDPAKAGFYRRQLAALRDWLFSAGEIVTGGLRPAEEAAAQTGGAGVGEGEEAGTVKVRIPEVSHPFDEAALPGVVQFMKTLTLAAKNMRVFPEGSQLVRQEVEAASTALIRLLESVEGVTLAERRGALLANGRTVEGKALAALAQELLRFFREQGIRSITFARGIVDDEVQALVRLLSGPRLGLPPQVSQWEKALESRGIMHVGVFPAIYLATTKRAATAPARETILDDEGMRLSAEVFRSLAGAVDNLRLYPPENELNISIQDKLERQAQALLDLIPAVTVALAEDTIVINGVRANPKWFGITSPLLHRLLQESGLTSVTLSRGVTRADLQVLLTQLAQRGSDEATNPLILAKLLDERGITTIQIGARFYTAARASLTGGGRPGEGASGEGTGGTTGAAPGPARTEEERLLEQVAEWLNAPLSPPGFSEEQLSSALNSWVGSDRTDLANRLLERIMAGLGDPQEGTRQRAASSLNLLLRGANPRTLAWLREQSFQPLETALLKETSSRVFQWEVRAATEALKLRLQETNLARALGLAKALGTGQAGRPDQKKLLPMATAAVEAMATAGVLEPLRAGLKAGDPARREESRAVLAALGEGALPFTAGIVAQDEDLEVRKAAAPVLGSLPGGAGLRLLGPQLRPPTPGEVSRRIVSVLDLIAPELGPDFTFLLAHPDVLVRAEFAGTVARLPRAVALRFLGRALDERESAVLVGALESVRGIQARELLEVVVRLLKRQATVEVMKAACLCLGQLKDERSLPSLIEVVQRRPRFLGLVKGLPETVRAAAARALGELASPQGQPALRAALKDRSMAVRSTARLALSRLRPGRES